MSTNGKSLTFALMDPPFEVGRVTTAFRLMEAALKKGIDVNVFAYEGAVTLGFKEQKPHPNAVKGTNVEDEGHPLTKDWVAGLFEIGTGRDGHGKLDWVNCGLCVDERGMEAQIAGRRGTPADFNTFVQNSTNVLTIGTE